MSPAEMFSLRSRRALVTGANRGIGAAIAVAFAEAGADVAVHHLGRREDAEEIARRCGAFGGRAVTIEDDLAIDGAARRIFDAAVKSLGACDILVLNASIEILKDWLAIAREDFDRQVAVNYRSSLELLQLAAPGMIARRWGRILTVGSVQEGKPYPQMLVYSSLKNAQTAMALNLARQLAPHGVTVNNIAPGVMDTDRTRERLARPEYRQRVIEKIPLGAIGAPADCAGAALLLCSDAGRYITGQSLYVDGGMSL